MEENPFYIVEVLCATRHHLGDNEVFGRDEWYLDARDLNCHGSLKKLLLESWPRHYEINRDTGGRVDGGNDACSPAESNRIIRCHSKSGTLQLGNEPFQLIGWQIDGGVYVSGHARSAEHYDGLGSEYVPTEIMPAEEGVQVI